MRLSFVQKLELLLLKQLINVLWLVDVVTGEYLYRPATIVLVAVLFPAFIFVYKYSLPVIYQKYFVRQENFSIFSRYDVPQILGTQERTALPPRKVTNLEFPKITAKSLLIVDKPSGTYLYSLNENSKYASASTTKLMTAIVAMEIYDMEEQIVMPKKCMELDATRAGLGEGSVYKVIDLMNAMLIGSAADAACALSSAKVDPNEFLFLMNKKAANLGMTNTFFENTVGLDGVNGAQFSTASDLFKLASSASKIAIISSIVRTKDYTVESVDKVNKVYIKNTNKLLFDLPGTIGIKTGTTVEAGEVLIFEYNLDKKDIIIIVMGSVDRFSDTRSALGWVLDSYSWDINID